MPKATSQRLEQRDFTHAELAPFLASAQKNATGALLVHGEGRAREATTERLQQRMKAAKVEKMADLPHKHQPSGLHLSFAIDKQMLDDWLRPQIKDLRPIGQYMVVQPPRNPEVALRVRWEVAADLDARRHP